MSSFLLLLCPWRHICLKWMHTHTKWRTMSVLCWRNKTNVCVTVTLRWLGPNMRSPSSAVFWRAGRYHRHTLALLCVTVPNLLCLVCITSQVRQPVNPTNETRLPSTSGIFRKTQTPLGWSEHGQLIPKCACCCFCCCSTVCASSTNSHQLIKSYSELLPWNIPHKSCG